MRPTILLLSIVLLHLQSTATQWQVGPGETYTAPSQVSDLVGNGDTVNIAAGTYPSDVARWQANDLLLRGVGGMAHLESNGMAWGGKAIWVIQGDRTRVEWIEFSECMVPDNNGAGIRQEGHHLNVQNCYFHHNENGILAGDVSPSNITIEHCEFAYHGYGQGFTHNLYINHVDTFFFRYNYSHHAHVGHEVKSRATVNFIEYNRISNEATGDASREIDLPNGGQAFLIGNVVQQGPNSPNSNMIGFGLEGLINPGPHEIIVINNTLVNEKMNGSYFHIATGNVLFKGYSNILAGGGSFMSGAFPAQTDTLGNVRRTDIADVLFTNAMNYDYHITGSSPAASVGFPAGYSNSGYALVAWDEYVHPLGNITRCQHATLDAGAFETCTVGIETVITNEVNVWPVPTTNTITVDLGVLGIASTLQLIDAQGRTVLVQRNAQGTTQLDLHPFTTGVYTLRVISGDLTVVRRVVKE